MTDLSHLDEAGDAHMVDVGSKPITRRRAVAEALVDLASEAAEALFGGTLPKGDALGVVRVAAIMGAKQTAALVPLCHPIGLDHVAVAITRVDNGARIEVTCEVEARTGVEMEAMTGASIGAVALYDMVKGVDRSAQIVAVRLLAKSGGRSGEWTR
ncbi:MAG: cyclic pyranopterin monophosphate synthase MoaC [Acidimicrobiia bacterium]|nr:cyclic pyranopterin monophosphate synthase MoaC [Acidimicrobiia bacterium]